MTAEEIREAMHAANLSIRDLADATGIDENKLSKSLGKVGRRIQVAEMAAIAAVLTPEEEAPPRLRTIPHLGSVPAGSFQPSSETGGSRFAVSDPDTPVNAYALTVVGDSMDLIVPSGATLVIDPNDKTLWEGRRYVVRTQDGETTFKEFQNDPPRLVPCSSNPAHHEIIIGHEPIAVEGRVFSYSIRDLPRREA